MRVSIFHKGGNAKTPHTISAIDNIQKINVNLKRLAISGSSMKKDVSTTSFDVAPQLMSMENMCDRIACETCIDIPPRKIKRSGTHWKQIQSCCESFLPSPRYRTIANARLPQPLKMTIKATQTRQESI